MSLICRPTVIRGILAKQSSTRVTVLIAGAANIGVGVIKLAAGILVGSSAMLAEAAHSAADTLNQAFLLTSVHRGEARRGHVEVIDHVRASPDMTVKAALFEDSAALIGLASAAPPTRENWS